MGWRIIERGESRRGCQTLHRIGSEGVIWGWGANFTSPRSARSYIWKRKLGWLFIVTPKRLTLLGRTGGRGG